MTNEMMSLRELADHQRLTLVTEVDVHFVPLGFPGSAARTETPTDCRANIFRLAPMRHIR